MRIFEFKVLGRKKKFKVWDRKKKKFVNNFAITDEGELIEGDESVESNSIHGARRKRFVVCYNTGLKDKAGVEIFEGDILSNNTWVEIQGCEVILKFYEINGHGKKTGEVSYYPWHNFKCFDGVYKYSSLEIIGNIYKNNELLK